MSLELTRLETLKVLKEVVDERPDYVYTDEAGHRAGEGGDCVYFDSKGQPACIAGHVLARLGLKREDLRASPMFLDMNEGITVGRLHHRGIVTGDEKAVQLLDVAQSRQDVGDTWGESYRRALLSVAIEP